MITFTGDNFVRRMIFETLSKSKAGWGKCKCIQILDENEVNGDIVFKLSDYIPSEHDGGSNYLGSICTFRNTDRGINVNWEYGQRPIYAAKHDIIFL